AQGGRSRPAPASPGSARRLYGCGHSQRDRVSGDSEMTMGALFSRIRTFFALAPGPHPRRELTLTPRGGFACPPRGVAAGAFALAPGPHRLHPNAAAALGAPPQRELALTSRGGFACPPRG